MRVGYTGVASVLTGKPYALIEKAIDEGVEPEVIKRWAVKVVVEREFVQRIFNAAKWYKNGQ